MVFNLFRKTKREYIGFLDEMKVKKKTETTSEETIRDPQNIWKKLKSS